MVYLQEGTNLLLLNKRMTNSMLQARLLALFNEHDVHWVVPVSIYTIDNAGQYKYNAILPLPKASDILLSKLFKLIDLGIPGVTQHLLSDFCYWLIVNIMSLNIIFSRSYCSVNKTYFFY